MTKGITVKWQFHGQRSNRRQVRAGAGPVASVDRVPRIARLMALAIRFDQLIRDGVVTDQADLARLGHVSRARLTQIMNLLNLAPDIQEDLLQQTSAQRGSHLISERNLRSLTTKFCWRKQRHIWTTKKLGGWAVDV